MLCERLTDLSRVGDPRYMAEPKLDGQRAQVHVRDHRTVHVYSRPGRELLRHPGMAWLRDLWWPFASGVLDGEAVAGDGHKGVHAVFEARNRPDGAMAFTAFDILQLDGACIMREPWTARRKRLEDLLDGVRLDGVCVVPVTDDALGLWRTWVGMGGEGIVLKQRTALYRPGHRSPAWLKLKPKLTLDVVVTGGTGQRIPWGDWGEAMTLELHYTHPRTRGAVAIRQAVRIARGQPFALRAGRHAEVVCWGVMPSGMLRHPLFVRWRDGR